ncbi:MAG: FMN-binding protein [Clostridiales bacterium]|nr:FMN-binding protein [Clostridiales bacterium]
MDKQKKWAGWLVLTVIAALAAVALAMTNQVTEGPIRQQNMERAHGALMELFPEADDFEAITLTDGEELQSAYAVKKAGDTVGYAATIASQGYAGPVEVIVGMEPDFVLRGIRVGGSEFKETEGLGSKAKEPAFTGQFQGKQPPLALGKEIEGISGATITSTAVVEGTNQAVDTLKAHLGQGQAAPGSDHAMVSEKPTQTQNPAAAVQTEGGRTANASVIGYAGPVLVRLTLDEKGAISDLRIGGERMMETVGVGTRVMEESFTSQFIGKTPPIQAGDVELLSGATISSTAAVEAVNQAAAFLTDNGE